MRWGLASVILLGVPALAQQPSAPSNLASLPAGQNQADSIRLMSAAQCIVKAKRKQSEGVVAMPLLSAEQDAAARNLLARETRCAMPIDPLPQQSTLLIAGMAEALFLEKFGSIDPAAVAARGSKLQPRNGMEDLALCVIRREPSAPRRLLGTAPASASEAEAMGGMGPHLGPCLPAGMTLTFGNAEMRVISAAGLYLSAHKGREKKICKEDDSSPETRLRTTVCRTEREWEEVRERDLIPRR